MQPAKYALGCLAIAGLMVGTIAAASNDRAPRAAAEAGFRAWVHNVAFSGTAIDDQFVLNVASVAELQKVTLGAGVPVETVNSAELLRGGSVARATHATGEWRYVAMLDGRAVGLVDVARFGSDYAITGVGAKGLAEDMASAFANHPGADARFVRSFDAKADFLRFDAVEGATFAPLLAARLAGIGTASPVLKSTSAAAAVDLGDSEVSASLRQRIVPSSQ